MKKIGKLLKSKSFYLCLAVILVAALIARLPDAKDLSSVEVVEELKNVPVRQDRLTLSLSAPGIIADAPAQDLALASQVEISQWLVSNGDYVEEGQAVALVELSSVRDAIETVNAAIKLLDGHLEITRLDSVGNSLRSSVAGRIKAVYVQPGDSVQQIMSEQGCLMLISLDGQLALELSCDTTGLTVGQSVELDLSDSRTVTGTVAGLDGSLLRVTIPDDVAALDESASVSVNGQVLGTGRLFVNRPLKVCGYWGSVAYVNVQPDDMVIENQLLLGLENIEYTGRRDRLLSQRQELEEQLAALYDAYTTGSIRAPFSGRISGIEKEHLNILSTVPTAMAQYNNSSGGVRFLGDPLPGGGISLLSDSGGTPGAPGGMPLPPTGTPAPDDPDKGSGAAAPDWLGKDGLEALDQLLDQNLSPEDAEKLKALYRSLDLEALSQYLNPDFLLRLLMPQSQMGYMGGGLTIPSFTEPDSYLVKETVYCSLTRYDKAEIALSIDQRDIFHYAPGQKLLVTLDALPGEEFEAEVVSVNTVGESKNQATKYTVKLEMPRSRSMLSGMSCTATLSLGESEEILLIPCAALQEDGSGVYVYTDYDPRKDQLLKPVYVETGLSDGEQVEITNGLSAGQQVCYRYATALRYRFLNSAG